MIGTPVSRRVRISGPLDLRATLRPLHGRFRNDGWWHTVRTDSGPATLKIVRDADHVVGEAWGPGAEDLLERLAAISGLEDDPGQFVTDHPIVGELHRRNPGMRFGRTGRVFDALVVAICGQKVTGTEAAAAVRGLSRRFSEPAPGPAQLRLPPDPEQMARAPYWEFHPLHLEKRRADLLRRVAADAIAINALETAPSEDARLRLAAHRGIAEWTTASTVGVSHGDADAVPVGDYHIKHTVVYHLTGRPRGTDEEMLELLEEFRPHRNRVVRLLHTLGHEPAFGPRSTPRNITRM